jgi:phosphomannomutase/phosphoglucomutase
MEISDNVFRAYDIRGIYPKEINEEFALKIGKAFGTFNPGKIVVGRDCRLSSPSLKEKVIEGLISTGCEVIDIGVVHTPLVIFSVAYYNFDGGIQITASHNPKEWNGFLFYGKNGVPISYEKGINKIKDLFFSENFKIGKGRVVTKDVIDDYKRFIFERIKLKTPLRLKVVIDAGNGVVGPIILPIFKTLGINVVELFCEPDGNFPNREPEPTKENLGELVRKVKEVEADLGLAFDGDGDRLVAVDEKGNILTPAQLFGILIKAYLKGKGEKVVHDALTSSAIDELIQHYKGMPVTCRVGHVYLQEKLLSENAVLGGEVSGHYFFKEIFGADDAVFASLRLIEHLINSGKKLSECYAEVPHYFFDTVRVKIVEEKKFEFIEKLKEEFKSKGYKIDTLDGVKVILPWGWALFRPSNTEPKIVISYEAKTEENFKKIKIFVNDIVEKIPK